MDGVTRGALVDSLDIISACWKVDISSTPAGFDTIVMSVARQVFEPGLFDGYFEVSHWVYCIVFSTTQKKISVHFKIFKIFLSHAIRALLIFQTLWQPPCQEMAFFQIRFFGNQMYILQSTDDKSFSSCHPLDGLTSQCSTEWWLKRLKHCYCC